MKQRIINDICLKLSELGIPYTIKEDAYICVSEIFYDIGLSADLKKVRYDLTVHADDVKKSVQLYVSTVDESLLPGTGSHTAARPAIFRKVKRVRIGEDGQSVVETVDLGIVPNAAKDAAFRCGWKFGTAFNLNKPRPPSEPGPVPFVAIHTEEVPEPEDAPPPDGAAGNEKSAGKTSKSLFKRLFSRRGRR